MDASPDQHVERPDGVLVVRSMAGAAGGRRVFRVTTGVGADDEPVVTVVSDVYALHAMIDDWIASLGS